MKLTREQFQNPFESAIVTRFDDAVDAQFEPLRTNKFANRIFYTASELGNHSIIWHALNWLGVLVGLRDVKTAARITGAIGIESALINGPVKMLTNRERPQYDGDHPLKLRTPQTSSFPSGHATSAMCAAYLLTRHSRCKPMYYVIGAIVATSRIHVRSHHASDVVAGAIAGAALGPILARILRIPH